MTTISSKYNIELRDKDGNLKSYLTPFCSRVGWKWNRLGGCGRCSITINKAYRDIIFDARDDIQIRLKNVDYDQYTKLLVHFDGADAAQAHTAATGQVVTFVATAQLDTVQKKFGSASLLLDGDSDWVTVPASDDWNFGAAPFTIDFWIRFDNLANAGIFELYEDAENKIHFYWIPGTKRLTWYIETGNVLIAEGRGESATFVADTWHHIEFSRNGEDLYIFLDGVSLSITETIPIESQTIGDIAGVFAIGASPNSGLNPVDGWIDEFRISKGICKHTANFTKPAEPYTYSGVTTASKLVYRGYIANIVPSLKVNQDIKLDVRGYSDLLKKIIVQTTGDTRSYPSGAINLINEIVDDICDTFIVANSSITKGTIDTGGGSAFDIDAIDFLTTVEDALRTLAELAGDVEYGVDENLVFYWRTESTSIRRRFFVGNNVSLLERKVNFDNLVNKIYLVGGDVAGSKYKGTGESTDSQSLYGLNEEIINNSSITSAAVKTQLITSILTERSIPQFSIRGKIQNTELRLEDTIPVGLITFYDATYDQDEIGDIIGDIIGATVTIITSSIANPSIIYAKAHGYLNGQTVLIAGHTGETPEIEGAHVITVLTRDTGTDLACADGDAANPEVTSATHTFVAADVGHYLHISAGTSWTPGWYAIASVAAGAATLGAPCGANGALTAGTWQLGEDSFSIPVNVTAGGTGGTAVSNPANGSDILIGETGDGGDDVTIGGQYSAQVNNISYSLSDTNGRMNIAIQLGDTILETAAKIKRLERELASVTQHDQ